MTDKTWIATALELGKLTMHRHGTVLQIQRRYKFLDVNGDVLVQVAGNSVLLDVEITDIPADILAALQAIDQWTMAQALVQEEMS